MNPSFFATINVAAVQAVFANADGTLRVYPFGEAPRDPPPRGVYAVYQIPTGFPGQYLGQVPDYDSWTVTVDVYAAAQNGREDEAIRSVAEGVRVLRDAVEPVATITTFRQFPREPDTRLFRSGFDVDFVASR